MSNLIDFLTNARLPITLEEQMNILPKISSCFPSPVRLIISISEPLVFEYNSNPDIDRIRGLNS
ncbi:hypothetical protein H5410_045076 [Solanum commersonii]|uniref:Uncharacterized protein n=1 Tax=Solanum commersonii TaxID=4109 RepID=A0A9J5XA07_SOLCO|nr:hypothetical protein H5410_045076 [Solanum commersonii]